MQVVQVDGVYDDTTPIPIKVDADGNALIACGAGAFVSGFKFSQSFTRPADTIAYTSNDAITNSTTAPSILSQDLASFGATAGQFLVVTNARVVSSVKGSGFMCNIHIYPVTFTATNDNSELNITDAVAETGGLVIPCLNNNTTASNAKAVSDPGWWEMQLTDTTIYVTLESYSSYTPTGGEKFTVIIEGFLL